MPASIDVRNLAVTVPERGVFLRLPALEVAPGETVLLSGESGSGKSTVLSIVSGTTPFRTATGLEWSGSVSVSGTTLGDGPIAAYRSRIFRLAQKPQLENPDVEETFRSTRGYRAYRDDRERFSDGRINAVLEALGLAPSIRRQRVQTISGGEAARVAIARMVLLDRPVLLLDEPTSALDSERASSLLDVIRSFVSPDTAILVVSHDPAVMKGVDRVYRIGGAE